MNTGAIWYLQKLAQDVESTCRAQKGRLLTARTMREVKNLSTVHVKPELRHIPGVRTAREALRTAAEDRMQSILKEQLQTLAALTSTDEFKLARGRLIRNDWAFLRGEFASIYRQAERESKLLLSQLERSAPVQQVSDEEEPDTDSPNDAPK